MKIILTDGYYITEDSYNYILKQVYLGEGKNKKLKEMERTVGYYSNGLKGFKACLRRYLEDLPLDSQKSAEWSVKDFHEHLDGVITAGIEEITKNISDRIKLDMRSCHDKQ